MLFSGFPWPWEPFKTVSLSLSPYNYSYFPSMSDEKDVEICSIRDTGGKKYLGNLQLLRFVSVQPQEKKGKESWAALSALGLKKKKSCF